MDEAPLGNDDVFDMLPTCPEHASGTTLESTCSVPNQRPAHISVSSDPPTRSKMTTVPDSEDSQSVEENFTSNECKIESNIKRKLGDAMEEHLKDLTGAFALAVTVQSSRNGDYISRHGSESLFDVLQSILPEVCHVGTRRHPRKGMVGRAEFNKVLQSKFGFTCARTRRKSILRVQGVGNWLFLGRRWLDPTNSEDRTTLEAGYDTLCTDFPVFRWCSKDRFMLTLSKVVTAWSNKDLSPSSEPGQNSLSTGGAMQDDNRNSSSCELALSSPCPSDLLTYRDSAPSGCQLVTVADFGVSAQCYENGQIKQQGRPLLQSSPPSRIQAPGNDDEFPGHMEGLILRQTHQLESPDVSWCQQSSGQGRRQMISPVAAVGENSLAHAQQGWHQLNAGQAVEMSLKRLVDEGTALDATEVECFVRSSESSLSGV